MAWFIGQSLLMLIVAFLLGLFVGWLIWARFRRPAPAAVQPAAATPAAVTTTTPPPSRPEPVVSPMVSSPEPEPEPVAVVAPLMATPPMSAPDDLKRIEGIGPKMAAALNTAGIATFEDLAGTAVPTLENAIRAAGLRFAPSLDTWSEQARLLADGDEAGFLALTEALVGGRRRKGPA